MDSKQFQFTWKIANFSMLPHQNGRSLKSSYFTVDNLDGSSTDWCLILYPRGDSRDKNCLGCFLSRKTDDNQNKIKIDLTLTLENVLSTLSIKRISKDHEFAPGDPWGWYNFVSLKLLYDDRHVYLLQDVLTIKCHVFIKNSVATEINENLEVAMPSFPINNCASITQIEVGRRSVTWPIAKIKNCVECKSKTAIQVDSALEDAPCFKLLLHFSDDSNCEYAQIEITQTKPFSSEINHFVKCKMAVMSAQKEYQHSQEDTFLFSSETSKKWNFPEFLKIAYLVEDKYINLDNTLYLLCEFSFTHGYKVSHTEISTYDQEIFQALKVSQVSHLSNTIQKLYLSRKFCDVNLQVGEESFPAQKVVLCAQSPVFYAMFENDMKEKNTNVVKIDDVETDTLELMLEFLHSNVMKEGLSTDEILNLFSAADKYQISLLKYQCAILLLSLMTVENVCEVLTAADRHHDDFLLASVLNFLKVHYVQVFNSPKWKEFMNEDPKLFGNVMIEVFQNS